MLTTDAAAFSLLLLLLLLHPLKVELKLGLTVNLGASLLVIIFLLLFLLRSLWFQHLFHDYLLMVTISTAPTWNGDLNF